MSIAVATGHEYTAKTAVEILKAGGNAVDAAIAAFIASWVVEPCMTSAGGGAFANVAMADGSAFLFDFFTQTPRRKRPEKELDFYPIEVDFGDLKEVFHIGKGTTGVPGSVAGVFSLHEAFGTIPLRELAQPAIEAAKTGTKINAFQYLNYQLLAPILKQSKRAKQTFFPNEYLIQPGEIQYFPQMADFLDFLTREGRNAFYQGEVAHKVVRDFEVGGGQLTMDDFKNYQVNIRKPLAFSYRNRTILSNPLPSIGGSLIAIFLKRLELESIPKKANSREQVSSLYKVLSSMENIEQSPTGGLGHYFKRFLTSKRGSTTHISIVDKNNNAVSLSTTNGEGCGYFIDGTDIQLNNMLGEAALQPNGFHTWEENVRLSSMMAPTIVLDENELPEIVLGSGGAGRIATVISQVLHYLIDYDMPVAEAVAMPRVHLSNGILNVEFGFPALTKEAFKHEVNEWNKTSLYYGGVHTLKRVKDTWTASGDARRDGVGM